MYCGEYARYIGEKPDNFFYLAFNSHWEEHILALPKLPKGKSWHKLLCTGEGNGDFLNEKLLLEDQKEYMAAPRSGTILIGL